MSAEFCQAPMRALDPAPGEFSESIKKDSGLHGAAHGRGGKNPAVEGVSAHLFHQAKTGGEQVDRDPLDMPSRAARPAPESTLTDGLPPLVTGEVTGPHAREGLALGVDIGNSGGLALVTADGALVDVAPMPVLADGPKGRPTVNGPLLAALVRRWAPSAAYVELVGPRPGEAAGGAFSFGRARGLIEGVLAAQGVPARHLTPATWKRAVGIPPGRDGVKDLARAEACRRWPAMAERFAAKGSDGLAEAGLIAVAGMAREALGR